MKDFNWFRLGTITSDGVRFVEDTQTYPVADIKKHKLNQRLGFTHSATTAKKNLRVGPTTPKAKTRPKYFWASN